MKENLLRRRFEKRVTIKMHCRIVTPMFLGDAYQKAALRTAPFKGLLRYWWRVAAGIKLKDHKNLLEKEVEIFGGGGEKAKKSLVKIWVEGNPNVVTDKIVPPVENVFHPEVGSGRYVSPLLYLGYGPVTWDKGPRYTRSYLAPGETFTLNLAVPAYLLGEGEEAEIFKTALLYFRAFGAAGSRSRNGWGSFQVEEMKPFLKGKVIYFPWNRSLFNKDYPQALGAQKINNHIKPLLWRTKKAYPSWEDTMRALAQIYIEMRTKLSPDGTDDIAERHLLGFPLTRHPAKRAPNWGSRARHASALRFFIRKKPEGYAGFVLHLPFGISDKMRLNASGKLFFTPQKQYEIWEKVHKCLDQAMQRASINECL